MSVVDLHPEELFDKLEQGSLTSAEEQRLHTHLASCDLCRFELAVRGDFRFERAMSVAPEPRVTVTSPPREERRARSRGPRRAWIVIGVAAATLVASGALAAGLSGVWQTLFAPEGGAVSATRAAPAQQGIGSRSPTARASAPVPVVPSAAPIESSLAAPMATRERDVSSAAPTAPARAASAPLSRRSTQETSATVDDKTTAASLFVAANRERASGNSGAAVNLYRSLQQRFPRSAEAELSQLTLASLLLHLGDARGALSGYDTYLSRSSRPLEAEAMVGRARALGALGRREAETQAWRAVAERYPATAYARRAAERLSSSGQR